MSAGSYDVFIGMRFYALSPISSCAANPPHVHKYKFILISTPKIKWVTDEAPNLASRLFPTAEPLSPLPLFVHGSWSGLPPWFWCAFIEYFHVCVSVNPFGSTTQITGNGVDSSSGDSSLVSRTYNQPAQVDSRLVSLFFVFVFVFIVF